MTDPLYRTPKALESAIKSRAKTVSAESGVSINELVRLLSFQRFLARIFTHDPVGWMIKGGQALLVRYPTQARNSRDIDLYRPSAESVQEAVEAVAAAAATHLDDYFSYALIKTDIHSNPADGAKITFQASIGTRQAGSFTVDLVTNRLITSTPTTVRLHPAIPIDWPSDWPEVTLYPIHDHIADKICAIYEWHNGMPSSRYRDLADLLFIAQKEHIDGRKAATALLSEKQRRTGSGTDLRLPAEFVVPEPASWRAAYPGQARLILGLEGCRTLDEAIPLASTFLNPILKGKADIVWHPDTQAWTSRA